MTSWDDPPRNIAGQHTEPIAGSRITPTIAGMIAVVLMMLATAVAADAQDTRIRDLTVTEGDIPTQLMGYGLVIGLDGTGDRVIGGYSSGQTVAATVNILRRFGVEVPANVLRTRNVAAVLVTATVSPYLRPGSRFDVHVSSLGDAVSLRGGVLYQTPLQPGAMGTPVAAAQGALLVAESTNSRSGYSVETTATLLEGGVLMQPLARTDFSASSMLYLKNPDIATAQRIVEAIDGSIGAGTAVVQDPGAVLLQLGDSTTNPAVQLASIGALTVVPERNARVIIDSRAGTVIAGGNILIGEAVVSHGQMTLAIGGTPFDATDPNAVGLPPGDLRMDSGASVQDVAAALHGVAAPPEAIAAVFESLRQVGALTAQVSVR